jgi:putative FmdB family regulatory protein
MPLYGYRCPACGPFDAFGPAALAAGGALCPSCRAPAARTFTAPAVRAPNRQRQLEGLSRSGLRRVEKAQAGGATSGPLPAGARLDGKGRPVGAHGRAGAGAADRRPWQLGH